MSKKHPLTFWTEQYIYCEQIGDQREKEIAAERIRAILDGTYKDKESEILTLSVQILP